MALTLLGSYLEEVAEGDIQQRKEIGPLEEAEQVGLANEGSEQQVGARPREAGEDLEVDAVELAREFGGLYSRREPEEEP